MDFTAAVLALKMVWCYIISRYMCDGMVHP
jgi:hypothetical protein